MQKIAKALATFHEHMKPVGKDKTNPHFRNKYASLDSILEAIKDPLKLAGLTFVQLPIEGGKLKTILIESASGESIESTMDILLSKNDPQAQGSALSYARRYALSAILGISTDEDDDGNAATPAPKATPAPVQAAKLCNVCNKPHNGTYPTCIDCYRAKQTQSPTA